MFIFRGLSLIQLAAWSLVLPSDRQENLRLI